MSLAMFDFMVDEHGIELEADECQFVKDVISASKRRCGGVPRQAARAACAKRCWGR